MTPLDAARRSAAEEMIPYAFWLAARYVRRCPRLRDDLIGAAQLGLVEGAARAAHPPGTPEFRGYLRKAVMGRVIDELRLLLRWYDPLPPAASEREGDARPIPRRYSGAAQPGNEGGRKGGRVKLTMERAQSMRARHAEGASIAALAKEFGVTYPTARKVVRGIIWQE